MSQLTIPYAFRIEAAFEYAKQHISDVTLNHSLRTTAFALLLIPKVPPLTATNLDPEVVVLSTLLHDMGWTHTKSLVSSDKRFEVDRANIVRDFAKSLTTSGNEPWDSGRFQLLWDAIALHTTPSIAHH